MEAIVMKLKNTAFTNNVSVWTPSINDFRSNPDWGMEVGQSEKHTFTEAGIDEILTAMVYYKIQDENEVMVGLGKGGKLQHFNDYDDKEFVLTSLFPKVYLNGKKLTGQKLLMYITKDLRRKNNKGEPNIHFERRQLKFSKNLTYQGREVNKNCIEAISNIYGQKSSWAILKMRILNEDELHLYGIKVSDGERKYKNKDARNDEFEKLWKEQHPNEELNDECDAIEQKDKKKVVVFKQPPFTPSQIIYYGVPGCGKSNRIREDLKNVPEKNKIRVVFHPEYTNAEFIGQILPVTNGGIRYEFTPGPFTQIIKRAYLNPNEQFYLVIEEINRGNAAAIFGDTFQLLDRLKAGETDSLGNDPANAAVNTFTEGWSQYFVQNDDVNAYIRGTENSIQIGSIRFDSNTAIRLPPNLSILATMNTSDQNVFTLDNAFQRRFDMELVRNEFDLTQPAVNAQYNAEIDDTGIKWGQFWGWINAKITATLKGLSSTEDKRLGVWFVSNVGGIIDDKVFAEKVLKFLWDDVFKFKRPQVFAEGIDTLEKLINSFEKPSEGKERFDVFKDKANLVAFVASPTL